MLSTTQLWNLKRKVGRSQNFKWSHLGAGKLSTQNKMVYGPTNDNFQKSHLLYSLLSTSTGIIHARSNIVGYQMSHDSTSGLSNVFSTNRSQIAYLIKQHFWLTNINQQFWDCQSVGGVSGLNESPLTTSQYFSIQGLAPSVTTWLEINVKLWPQISTTRLTVDLGGSKMVPV